MQQTDTNPSSQKKKKKQRHQSTIISTSLLPSFASQVSKLRSGKLKIITKLKTPKLFKLKRTQATTNANLHIDNLNLQRGILAKKSTYPYQLLTNNLFHQSNINLILYILYPQPHYLTSIPSIIYYLELVATHGRA